MNMTKDMYDYLKGINDIMPLCYEMSINGDKFALWNARKDGKYLGSAIVVRGKKDILGFQTFRDNVWIDALFKNKCIKKNQDYELPYYFEDESTGEIKRGVCARFHVEDSGWVTWYYDGRTEANMAIADGGSFDDALKDIEEKRNFNFERFNDWCVKMGWDGK